MFTNTNAYNLQLKSIALIINNRADLELDCTKGKKNCVDRFNKFYEMSCDCFQEILVMNILVT